MLRLLLTSLFFIFLGISFGSQGQTRVVILGTGTPVPENERSGPGVAVITNGEAYVFDAGGGMVKKAAEAYVQLNIPELNPQNIDYLFLTHLHSDHIHDVPELSTARWWGRQQPLSIWGPAGIAQYVSHMREMATIEADIRSAGFPQELITDSYGYLANATEIEDGIVFRNDDITVEAFTVPHGDIRPAFGYRVTTADKTIVISGDTTYSERLVAMAQDADLLIHEVYSRDRLLQMSEFWQNYHGSSHTSTQQVASIANQTNPGQVVLYHILFLGATAEEIVAEVKREYDGNVILANDLDEF